MSTALQPSCWGTWHVDLFPISVHKMERLGPLRCPSQICGQTFLLPLQLLQMAWSCPRRSQWESSHSLQWKQEQSHWGHVKGQGWFLKRAEKGILDPISSPIWRIRTIFKPQRSLQTPCSCRRVWMARFREGQYGCTAMQADSMSEYQDRIHPPLARCKVTSGYFLIGSTYHRSPCVCTLCKRAYRFKDAEWNPESS